MSKNEMLEIIWNVKGPNSISPFLPMEFIQEIFDEVERQYHNGRDEKFIRNTIEGGIDYTSTEKYINNIRKLLWVI